MALRDMWRVGTFQHLLSLTDPELSALIKSEHRERVVIVCAWRCCQTLREQLGEVMTPAEVDNHMARHTNEAALADTMGLVIAMEALASN